MTEIHEGTHVLTVTAQRPITTLTKGGREVTLYDVKAVDANGEPVQETLRTFAELPLGDATEYTVERYESERHGVSYTLHKPRENTGRRVQKLEKQFQSLADRVSALEQRLGGQV